MTQYLYYVGLALSLLGNAALAVLLVRSRRRPPKRLDQTAQELLQELTSGGVVLSIEVINKESILLRR